MNEADIGHNTIPIHYKVKENIEKVIYLYGSLSIFPNDVPTVVSLLVYDALSGDIAITIQPSGLFIQYLI